MITLFLKQRCDLQSPPPVAKKQLYKTRLQRGWTGTEKEAAAAARGPHHAETKETPEAKRASDWKPTAQMTRNRLRGHETYVDQSVLPRPMSPPITSRLEKHETPDGKHYGVAR